LPPEILKRALTICLPLAATSKVSTNAWTPGANRVTNYRIGAAVGGLLALFIAAPALAGAQPRIDSAVFVERTRGAVRALEQADRLTRGDRVVTILSWREAEGGGFTVTNQVPRSLAYQGSAHDDEEVSVDGGRSWGQLGKLTIGSRQATTEDVTHVRWRIPAARAASGRIAYSGIVR
jgi:hypothetical protein